MKHLAGDVSGVLYCAESPNGKAVFQALAAQLFALRNSQVAHAGGAGGLDTIRNKSAVSLRGIVVQGLQAGGYCVVLDHLHSPSQLFAAELKNLCQLTAVSLIVAARSAHMEDVGFLLPLFSDRTARYALRNFDRERAGEFALRAANELHLQATNFEEVMEKIVRYSKGNPGRNSCDDADGCQPEVPGGAARQALDSLHRFQDGMGYSPWMKD